MTNPDTKDVFCRAAKQVTYWRNKWMPSDSYSRYKQTHNTPTMAWSYTLKYTVNGKRYPAW